MLDNKLLVFSLALSIAVYSTPGLALDKDQDIPSEDFLEFLGSWETNDGEWLDPMALQEEISDEQEQEKNDQDS